MRQWGDKTHVASDFRPVPRPDPNSTPTSDLTDNGTQQRSVKVTGFGELTASEITANRNILVNRLESKTLRGGPVTDFEVQQSRLAGREPFAIATFERSRGITIRDSRALGTQY